MSLVPLQTARSVLGWSPSRDTELQMTLSSVEKVFVSETRRLWETQTSYNEIIEVHNDEEYLFLRLYPNVANVSITGYDNDPADAEAIPATDYTVDTENGIIRKIRSEDFPRFVSVTYDGGYDTSTDVIPKDVQLGILHECRLSLTRNSQDKIGYFSSSGEGGGMSLVTLGQRHPDFIKAIRKYRRSAKNAPR